MTPILLSLVLLVFLFIIGIAFRKHVLSITRKRRDTELRMWCIEQAAGTKAICECIDPEFGISYATEETLVSLAEKYYLFLTEHTTYLTDKEKAALFPEKRKMGDG